MKNHMATHVESCRSTVFAESCEEVKTRLIQMCRAVEKSMSRKARAVYQLISRDCQIVLNRKLLPAVKKQMAAENHVKAEVAKLIQEREEN